MGAQELLLCLALRPAMALSENCLLRLRGQPLLFVQGELMPTWGSRTQESLNENLPDPPQKKNPEEITIVSNVLHLGAIYSLHNSQYYCCCHGLSSSLQLGAKIFPSDKMIKNTRESPLNQGPVSFPPCPWTQSCHRIRRLGSQVAVCSSERETPAPPIMLWASDVQLELFQKSMFSHQTHVLMSTQKTNPKFLPLFMNGHKRL